MKIKISKIVYIPGIVLLFILPVFSSAQTVSITSEKSNYNIGDSFLVTVRFDSTGKPVNTISGNILVPKDIFDISNIEIGKSFVSLWVDKPTYKDGEIHFSGGLPGGYSGSDGTIFTFIATLKAKINGPIEINLSEVSAYLNDGKGTAVSGVTLNALKFNFNKNSTTTANYQSDIDNISPEKFDIVLGRDISIDNNKYFVSFFTTDKGAGVTRYEIEERPWIISLFGSKKVWPDVKNLQVLEYQNWLSTIHVRAYDASNNVTEETVLLHASYIYYILILILSFFIMFKVKKCYNKKSKS